jgi:hypothetical protein
MPLTTKDAILGIQDKEIKKYYVKAWKQDVFLRVMSGNERDAFESSIIGDEKSRSVRMRNFRARLAVICLCDENGNNIFTEKDVKELGAKSAKALTEIMDYAMELNGISQKDQDELVKNSETTPEEEADSDSV